MLAYLIYPEILKLLTKYKINNYIRGVFPIQLVAFSTSSSAATLPFTMEHSQKELGISEETSSFVFLVGATVNIDRTSFCTVVNVTCDVFVAKLIDKKIQFRSRSLICYIEM